MALFSTIRIRHCEEKRETDGGNGLFAGKRTAAEREACAGTGGANRSAAGFELEKYMMGLFVPRTGDRHFYRVFMGSDR
ncbi:hypothetical protein HMSSN036_37640 [Paenibacillus macerans]|nr:hypothetical protein HMSSN036_37640 [Paenibacillus macerans]